MKFVEICNILKFTERLVIPFNDNMIVKNLMYPNIYVRLVYYTQDGRNIVESSFSSSAFYPVIRFS